MLGRFFLPYFSPSKLTIGLFLAIFAIFTLKKKNGRKKA
jgi:hypothetical protein